MQTNTVNNQNFAVIYKDHTYLIDPIKLSRSSRKFHDLIQPFMNGQNDLGKITLKINYSEFSDRNVENFLKLCQNIPTNCQNSEIEEICEIAKMFQADQIYNTGATFIRNTINPNFNIPENKYNNGQSFLLLSNIPKKAHHISDMNSLEFEDDDMVVHSNQENLNPNIVQDSEEDTKEPIIHSAIYRVKITQPLMKRELIQMVVDGNVLYTAKHKDNIIAIGKGKTVHFNKDKSNQIGIISREKGGINNVSCENQQYQVKYVYLNGPKTFSLETEFTHNGSRLHWKPKQPKFNNTTNAYTLSFHGEYHHQVAPSTKNTVLMNDNGNWTLIVRKTANQDFEVECSPKISKALIFSLALLQIIGPDASYSSMIRN